ncbi:MAG: hypothetical protein IJ309_04825 [Clostridia bacterium]|nr:hypothetical protein [Clostridia bacterium]
MERKILKLDLNLGLENENNGSLTRASFLKNIILKNGASCKRPGWDVIGQLKDEDGELKINGIFPFVENGQEELIVHAGTRLYKCAKDLSEIKEIAHEGFSIQDQRSQGVIIDNRLWLFGVGVPLAYDGELSLAVDGEKSYVPTTRVGITDIYSGDMYKDLEKPNLLTTKRKNRALGKDTYRTLEKSPVISLDGDILWGKPIDVEVRLRVRAYGDGVNENTSIYRGVNREGKEQNMVVVASFHLDSASLGATIKPSGPLYDEMGDEVTIKFEDETHYTYDTLPWYIRITGKRQLTFDFDAPTPTNGVDNIEITFHSQSEEWDLSKIRLGVVTTTESGQDVAVLVCGDNLIRYTDYEKGMAYIPTANLLQIGSGAQISAIVPVAGGYLGVFTENGFYKIKLPGGSEKSISAYKSTDKVGALSQWCCMTVDSDTVVLTSSGVYGVKTGENDEIVSQLYNRGTRIDNILNTFSREQLKGAVAAEHQGRLYLFIDGNVLVADSQKRSTRKGLGSAAFEYEWWLWDTCPARVAVSAYNKLYMGREDGTIATFESQGADTHKRRFSEEALTLAFSHDEADRSVYVASDQPQNGTEARVSPHRRRVAEGIKYLEQGLYSIPKDQLFDKNGALRVFEGDYYICKKAGAIIEQIKVLQVDPQACTLKCEARFTGENGYLYVPCDEKTVYTVKRETEGFSLWLGSEGAVLKGDSLVFTLNEVREIECEIVSCPISLGEPIFRKNLWGVYVKPTKSTTGEVEVEIETLRGKSKEVLRLDTALDFEELDLGSLAFGGSFDRAVYVPFFERGVSYLTLTLRSRGKDDFGIEAVYLCYTQGKKHKGEG